MYPKECPAEMTAVKRWALFLAGCSVQGASLQTAGGATVHRHCIPAGMPTAQRDGIWDGVGGKGDCNKPHSLRLRATAPIQKKAITN